MKIERDDENDVVAVVLLMTMANQWKPMIR
jgi:hypothetical protein